MPLYAAALLAALSACAARGPASGGSEATMRASAEAALEAASELGGAAGEEARRLADEAFDGYLEAHNGAREAGQMRRAHGALLMEMGRPEDAWASFEAAHAQDGDAESARAAIRAAEAALARGSAASVVMRLEEGPEALDVWERRLIDGIDRFIGGWSGDAEAPTLRYRAARILRDRAHYEEAVDRLWDLVEAAPHGPEAEPAARSILEILSARSDWAALAERSGAMLALEPMGGERFRRETAALHERATFRAAEAMTENAAEGAAAYLAFFERFPASERAEEALLGARARYLEAGDRDRAAEVEALLAERFPDSPFIRDR